MKVIQVPDRPASHRFYAVAGRLLFIDSSDVRLGNLVEQLFAGWQFQLLPVVEREADILIKFFCGDALPEIPESLNQFETAEGGLCYTTGDDYFVSLGNALIHLQNSSRVNVSVWFNELPGPIDPVFTRATSFAVCAALRRFGLFELHSAGVVHPDSGKGVVIVGPSGSGKSTLALRLAMAGWPYLSDDELLLGLVNGEVEARGFRSFFAVGEHANSPLKTCFEPDVILGFQRQSSARSETLLFTNVSGEQKSKVTQLTQAEAMVRLLRACPWATYDTAVAARHLQLLSQLARQTSAFDLSAGRDLLAPGVASDLVANIHSDA